MNTNYFDEVYEKTYRPLLRYAVLHLSSPADAEDALQNVYYDFCQRVERRGHLDILFPQQFLLKMLKREIIRNYAERSRQKSRLKEYAGDEPDDAVQFTFEDKVLDRAVADQIFSAAKALPAETYRVFVLYYGFEMSVSDISEELGIGKEAVKSRLFRARNELRKVLNGDIGQNRERGKIR